MLESPPNLIPHIPPSSSLPIPIPLCVIVNTAIANLDSIALSAVLKFALLDSTLVSSLTTDSIQQLLKAFRTGSAQTQTNSALMIRQILEHLDNDAYTIEFITKSAACPDFRIRLLAISMLPLVHDPTPLRNCFFSLTLDRIIPVRCAVLRQLPESHFHKRIIEVLIRNAVGDASPEVKTEAAKVIGDAAPHLLPEFCALLKNPISATAAFENLHKFVNVHGLAQLFDAVAVGAENAPGAARAALLRVMPSISDAEKAVAWPVIDRLARTREFGEDIGRFAEYYGDKRRFLGLFDPKKVANWRGRMALIRSAIGIVAKLPGDLVEVAAQFARDDVAIVRNASVAMWAALIRADAGIMEGEEFRSLLGSNWQTRLVAAKVIAEVGMKREIWGIGEELARDPVETVRSCFASGIKGTEWFDKLFGDSQQLIHIY